MLKRYFFFALLIVISLAGCSVNHTATVKINNLTIPVEVADEPLQREIGLSDHTTLPPDSGMLFVFEEAEPRTFWMKGMEFPIDIIWIENNLITGIEANVPVPTSTELLRYHSPAPVNYVLEVNAGFIDIHNINTGAEVIIDIKK